MNLNILNIFLSILFIINISLFTIDGNYNAAIAWFNALVWQLAYIRVLNQ